MRRVHIDVMFGAVVALLLVMLPAGTVAAAPSPSPSAVPAEERPRDGGIIDGKIAEVDFRRSILTVVAPRRGRVDVTVLPSTSIQTKDAGYHAISDLRPGDRVEIWSSITAGRYVAQIIRVR